jgi:hypothetical protein
MAAKKIISALSASAKNARQFVVPAETSREEDVILLFKDDLAAQKLEVVRLSVDTLQNLTFNGKPVIWLANFGIKKQGGEDYVDVAYTVVVTLRAGYQVVYFDGKDVKPANSRGVTLSDFPGKMAFDLNIGDPGVGITGN